MTTQKNERVRPRGEHRSSPANRQRILDATLEVAKEYGYQGTTIPRVSHRASHLIFGDAVNSDIVGVEIVLRVDKANLRIDLFSVLKGHNADLADATHPRIGCFKID